jgi:colicin import membrane protein
MIKVTTMRNAFFLALALHLFLVILLTMESHSSRPVLEQVKTTDNLEQPALQAQAQEIVKAVSVDNEEVMKTVSRLKQERADQQKAALQKQQALAHQLEVARAEKIKEQQQLAQMKEEENKIAIARKKQAEEEKQHLKELAQRQALEEKKLEELKQQKEKMVKQALEEKKLLEAKKQAELKHKKEQEQLALEKQKATQASLAKLKAEQADEAKLRAQAMKRQAEAEAAAQARQAEQNAQRQAQMSGEVDKYKALILNAIAKHWILPENADRSLASLFRLRLAPDGTVLEVVLLQSSGDPLLDRSAQTAIYKASPLPVPTDPQLFSLFRDNNLKVRPEQVRR